MTNPVGRNLIGKVVVVRTYSAGVHVGELVAREGREVELKDAHMVWWWEGANTLHELSQDGAAKSGTKISRPVPTLTLTEAIQILPCSEVAAKNLRTPRWG